MGITPPPPSVYISLPPPPNLTLYLIWSSSHKFCVISCKWLEVMSKSHKNNPVTWPYKVRGTNERTGFFCMVHRLQLPSYQWILRFYNMWTIDLQTCRLISSPRFDSPRPYMGMHPINIPLFTGFTRKSHIIQEIYGIPVHTRSGVSTWYTSNAKVCSHQTTQ